MKNYQQLIIYTPKTDISELYWEVKVNRKTFYCEELIALNELKQLCPHIKSATVENFTDDLNRNKIDMNNYHFGVIYVKM